MSGVLKFAYSKVVDGNMSYIYGDEVDVTAARREFLEGLKLKPSDSVIVQLEHGVVIHEVHGVDVGNLLSKKSQEKLMGDGLMTNTAGVVLFMIVADCIGAVIYDPINQAIALIHAGRKGVEQNILAKAVAKMTTSYGSKPDQLLLKTSPAISKESYVFDEPDGIDLKFWGDDVKKAEDGKYHMDIKSKFKKQALELGLDGSNINICLVDTLSDANYFSHRRSMASGEPEGRFAVVAQLEKS